MNKIKSGFTLIELLVAIAIVAVLSAISTQLLFDTITTESKQRQLETRSDTSYVVLDQIAKDVRQAEKVNVLSSSVINIKPTSTKCIVYQYNSGSKSVERGEDSGACSPASFDSLTENKYSVNNLTFSPIGTSLSAVSIEVEWKADDVGGVPKFIKYQTNVVPRL